MRILLLVLVVTIFLASCQKEVNFQNEIINTGGSSGNLLVRKVDKTGGDSVVYTYNYNAAKKLINQKAAGIDEQGSSVNSEYRYYWNASGMLDFYSVFDDELIALGVDSLLVQIHSASSRYNSHVIKAIMGSTPVYLDSIVFVYDGAGKIIRHDGYESLSGLGNDYFLTEKNLLTYTGANITKIDSRDLDINGIEDFFITTNLTYDSKTNPMHFGNDAFAMGSFQWYSANNITLSQATSTSGNGTGSASYTYNNNNKPATSTITQSPGSTINIIYYYQ